MFELVSPYQPAGDQPQAIAKLTEGLLSGAKHQTLLGVTGSGKTFTIANVIKNVNKPTLVISHNKTLAAQLYAEFKSFFPNNAVEYFVSYFDYYQPEAYIPRTDTFIEKDSSINEEIERLRLSTMSSLFSRRDVVVVASVSCIYGIGSKEDYEAMVIPMRVGHGDDARPIPAAAGRPAIQRATTSSSSAANFACAATRSKFARPVREDALAHRIFRRRDRAHHALRAADRRTKSNRWTR